MRLASTSVLSALLALAVAAPAAARADDPTPSTGATATTTAPPAAPREPLRGVLPEGGNQVTVEGKTSAASPASVLWAAPTGRMLNVRLSSPGGQAWMVVFRPGSDRAENGAGETDGAIAWISQIDSAGDLRFEVRTRSTEEIPFRVLLEVAPPEEPEAPARPAASQPAPPVSE